MANRGVPPAIMATINRYQNIEHLNGTLVSPIGFAMSNTAARPFPNDFRNTHQSRSEPIVGRFHRCQQPVGTSLLPSLELIDLP